MDSVIYSRSYPLNSDDNIFGDYFAMVLIGVRDGERQVKHFMLVSSKGLPPKILNDEEKNKALEHLFFGKFPRE